MRNKAASTTLTLVLLSFTLVLSTTLVSSQSSSPSSSNGDDDLIDQICKKTPFYDLCSTILHSNPLTPKSDPKGMALIMVKNIEDNATDTLNYIQDLIKKTPDQQLEQQLAFCAESYIPVVKYILPQAYDALNQGKFGFASYCISDAEKELDACNKKFDGNQSPLGDRNGIMQKLVDVASAIVKLLLNG